MSVFEDGAAIRFGLGEPGNDLRLGQSFTKKNKIERIAWLN
jgi:hypothetical protein